MKNAYEEKDGIGSVTDVDVKGRRIEGYLSSFNNVDSHNDTIMPTAFDKTVRERKEKILFLNQHSWEQPHGFFMTLEPDERGLKFLSYPLPNTTYSNDAIELYDAGIIADHSIGFIPVKWDWDDDTQIRTLKEIKLYEGSNVTVGADRNTPYLGRKAMTIEQINDQTQRITKMLRNGSLTDDTFVKLEIALKQLQMKSYERGKADAQTEPDSSTDMSQKAEQIARSIEFFNQTLKV